MDYVINGIVLFMMASVILGITVGIILLTYRRSNVHNNQILGVAVLSLAFAMTIGLLIESQFVLRAPHLYRTGNIFALIFVPSTYLYIRNVVRNRSLDKWDFIHFLPLALYVLDYLPFFLTSASEKIEMITTDLNSSIGLARYSRGWLFPVGFHTPARTLLIAFYWILNVIILYKFTKNDERAKMRVNTPWKNWILIFVLLQAFNFLPYYIGMAIKEHMIIFQIIIVSGSVSLILTSYYLFFRPQILYGLRFDAVFANSNTFLTSASYMPGTLSDHVGSIKRNGKNGENSHWKSAADKKIFYEKLDELMQVSMPFLKGGYSLPEMANDLDIHPHHLSLVLNNELGFSFIDYINNRRIGYCIERIHKGDNKNLTLEALAEECGFNNRNSFTAAFKRFQGVTPSEYIKRFV